MPSCRDGQVEHLQSPADASVGWPPRLINVEWRAAWLLGVELVPVEYIGPHLEVAERRDLHFDI
jgi:hypothetical protein